MDIRKFIIYTGVGAFLWNGFLTWVGYHLGSHWETVRKYSEVADIVLVVCIVVGLGYLWYKHTKKKAALQQAP